MPKLFELPSSDKFKDSKITEILIRSAEQSEINHYCHAIVLEEGTDGFLLLCAVPCAEKLGSTFYARRVGMDGVHPIRIAEELAQVNVREETFGYIHRGEYFA